MGEAATKARAIQVGTASGCANCRYYRKVTTAHKAGVCQRLPPTIHVVGMGNTPVGPAPVTRTLWPEVADTVWCGEWAAIVPALDFSRLDEVEGVG